jgi:hypothetical protein
MKNVNWIIHHVLDSSEIEFIFVRQGNPDPSGSWEELPSNVQQRVIAYDN